MDLRNNGLSPKAMHTLATALKGNVTLLHLKLSESAPVYVAGDDLIITEDLDNSTIQRQETSDINELEKILLANRELAKVVFDSLLFYSLFFSSLFSLCLRIVFYFVLVYHFYDFLSFCVSNN